ncbi:MAG: glycosyltransferase [Phycisphaerales bacterium]
MRLEDGGVVKAVLDLVNMSSSEDEVVLATLDPSGVPESWVNGDIPSITVERIAGDTGAGGVLKKDQLRSLEALIDGCDVVHLHAMWNTANPQIVRICRRLGKPYVISPHGMIDDWCMTQRRLKKVAYLKTWGRNLLAEASVVLCTAQAELDQASSWFDHGRGASIPLPFDLSEYETLPDPELAYDSFSELDRDAPKVLFLSRINYKKGIDRLIKASAILNRNGVHHQLVIAGTGEPEYVDQMKALARAEGNQEQAYFAGFAKGEPKVALFSLCDVFALPTSQENFGFVFFEALAAGTTVLTTKGTDTWPEIEQSGGGVIVDNTPEAFADALETLLRDRENTACMGEAGREWVLRALAAEEIRSQYRAMYNNCIKGNGGAV